MAIRYVTPPPFSARAAGGGNSTRNHDSKSAKVESRLLERLESKRCLLVVEDVWNMADLVPFGVHAASHTIPGSYTPVPGVTT